MASKSFTPAGGNWQKNPAAFSLQVLQPSFSSNPYGPFIASSSGFSFRLRSNILLGLLCEVLGERRVRQELCACLLMDLGEETLSRCVDKRHAAKIYGKPP